MTVARIPTGQRLLLTGIDWPTYLRLSRTLGARRSVRLTYDRGRLEIMTLSPEHERFKHLLRRLIEALTEELRIAIAGFGSMTFKRRRLRGLEPDECYWIASEPRVRGKDRIDLRVDPPPDLVLEIDWLNSSLDRMGIYAILGVPEVWRHDGRTLTFYVRGADGEYAVAAASLAFPFLTASDLEGFLALRGSMDENALVRHFRDEVRRRWLPQGGTANP
jgi:Uma2 family endonuclease